MRNINNKFTALALLAVIILMGACNDNAWDDVASPMQQFISKYFPFGEVKSCVEQSNGNQVVSIDNGATIVFDSDYIWVSVDGNGAVLPSMFVYDEFPSGLYQYLKETEQTESVYSVGRTSSEYILKLLNSTIKYDVDSETVTYPSAGV